MFESSHRYVWLKLAVTTIYIYKFDSVPSQSTLTSQEAFCDYQINLGNTTNLNSSV